MICTIPGVPSRAESRIGAVPHLGAPQGLDSRKPQLEVIVIALTGAFCLSLLSMLHMYKAPQHFSIGALAAIELLAGRRASQSNPQTNDLGV
ncbi:MAG: hypothetical protein JNM89_06675 [Hyphomicrobiaceae bacterium]|nr:hypothetical protein [Hyphomicrobiaceae bacterium]